MKNLFLFFLSLLSINCFPLFGSNDSKHLLEAEKRKIEIYKNTVSSVVNVSNVTKVRQGNLFFQGDVEEMKTGAGTGFVWDNQGHIVTNYHVVANERGKFYVSFANHKDKIEAKVIGFAKKLDIAVLKAKFIPSGVKPINPGVSKNLQVGQIAIAIGNPFELDYSMTSGIISALGRKIKGVGGVDIHGMIQTDASINPGNSGGPLLNSSGKLIGMNTLIYSRSGSSAGLGFAVPVDSISRAVPDIIKYGKMITPALGITIFQDSELRLLSRYVDNIEEGVLVRAVRKGSGAEEAGLKGPYSDSQGRVYIGDTILELENTKVRNLNDLWSVLRKFKIGQKVKVKIKRSDGSIKTVKVRLEPL